MPRVLVIDDQSDVRTMISIVLRINHFEIVEAATAAAGLKAFEECRFRPRDRRYLPAGSNGSDLIATMRERVPDLPVVAISGMTALDFVSESPELADVVCLQKPFRPNDLIARDRRGLAKRCGHRPAPLPGRRRGIPAPAVTAAADCPTRRLPAFIRHGLSRRIRIGRGLARRQRHREAAYADLRGASRIRPFRRAATRCWRSRSACQIRAMSASRPQARRSPPRPAASRPVSFSQLTDSRPVSVDSAPYLAELVTSSCSASASVCAVAGCS